jgi:hypothetical protein
MAIDQTERARRAWPHLARRASQNLRPCTYKEICAEIGLHWRAARYFLGVIQRHCRANGLPPLQFLAVNAKSRLPGQGCADSPRNDAAQQDALRTIYAYPWPAEAPF